jgi:hypothetical protein
MRHPILALAFLGAVASSGCGIQEHPHEKAEEFPPPGSSGETGGSSGSSAGTGGANQSGTGGSTGSSGTGGSSGNAGGSTGSSTGGRTGAQGGSTGSSGGSGGSSTPSAGAGGSSGSTPVPGGASITINGMTIPREKAIVIVHFGHSNMEGKGEDPASLRPYFYTKVPRLWQYKGNNSFVEAVEPLSRRSGTQAGPGMALLKAAIASAPSDYHFISIGRGVGSATSVDWSKGGLHYSSVVTLAQQLKGKVTFGVGAIMLGITERHLPASQQNGFPDRLAKIVSDLRADLETPDLPIVHTDFEVESTGEFAPTGAVSTKFRPMILSLPSKVQRLEIVPTDGTGMEDDHHFNLEGHKLWADRAIKIVLDKNWNIWPKVQ